MTGTLVNTGGIVVGALVGVAAKKGLPERINGAILKAQGLGIFLIALNGVLTAMMRVDGETGRLRDSGGLLLLVSLVLGCLVGELLRIEDRLSGFGKRIERHFGADGFAKGFVSATLIFCVGAMAVIGSIQDGLRGDSGVLLMKSALDFTTSIVLASTLGIGVLFSAIPVLIFQGGVTLLSGLIAPLITDALLELFCMVGYAVVLAIGVNFITDAKIRVANLLPALFVPIIYYAILPR